MRELVLKMSVSIDGFVARPDGAIGWVFSGDEEAIAWSVARCWDSSLHIMGSRTFRDMASYWPTATNPFAGPMNQIPKAIFTRRSPADFAATGTTTALKDARAHEAPPPDAPLQPGAGSWAEAYVARGELATEIARLKAVPGKPILAHGGAGFARSLVAAGLVDQYDLLVHPVVLGQGLPIFTGVAGPKVLKLVRSRPFPGGAVAQSYRAQG